MAAQGKGPRRASALQAQIQNGRAIVGIGNLRVMVVRDGDRWFAQGLEIDYAAEGVSLEEIKQAFAKGLAKTIQQNLRVFGSIENLLRVAPPEVWAEFYAQNLEGLRLAHSQVSVHSLPKPADLPLPFSGLDFYTPQQAVA